MVRLREIPRTAAFAWSTGIGSSWIVTGTKAGAVDVDFSTETSLELWDLALDEQLQDLQPKASLSTDSGFHDLAWTGPTDEHPKGIIAGALDSGALVLWDAEKLINDPSSAQFYNEKVHSGAIKALQFNPKLPNFLASGGAKGELYIHDINNLGSPIRLGNTAARADDIECLDWNKKVSNILVTGSSGGFVTVWDLKTKKASLSLNHYNRKPVSAVAWDPEKPTRLITGVPLEQEPVVLVWDLRNSNAPEKILQGHDSGVLSISWCAQDSDLLLSCGKDHRTILWNPQTGQAYGDYPVVTNWTIQTRWNPENPNMFATASFDGKLVIQTLQNTNPSVTQTDQNPAADGEDFFLKASTQAQTSSFSLPKAPKWLERPASVSFGFGGRLVSVSSADPGKSRSSKVSITKFEVDSSVGSATDSFEKSLASGDVAELCKSRIAEAKTEEEKADWQVMETLLSANPRQEIVKYLGFGQEEEGQEEKGVSDSLAKLGLDENVAESTTTEAPRVNGAETKGHRRFESVFANSADGDFLSQLAATQETRTNNPFQLFTGTESEADKKITNAVMLGQFEKALDIALAEDRMSDAFMLAICGGQQCIKKAQEAYFAKQNDGPNYLRLLASVVGKNLWDTVHNADLENWKEVMVTLCTFADQKGFPDLCEALGDRLEEYIPTSKTARKDAAFCYLAGSKLEKVVSIWIEESKEHEDAGAAAHAESSAFSLHAKGLQDLIEKVTIFRKVVNFQDTELTKTSDWKLDALYQKYLEYSDIVAALGQLSAAQRYLDLLPVQYPDASVARGRLQQATATKRPEAAVKAAPAAAAAAVAATARAPAMIGPSMTKPLPGQTSGYQPPQNATLAATPQPTPFAANPYAPAQPPSQPSNPYAPQGLAPGQPVNPYAPAGYQPPQQMRPNAGPPPSTFMGGASAVPPPPRMFNQSPSVAPPSQDKNMTNWNDIPDGFVKAPTSRRGTPSVATQPAPYGQGIAPPPPAPFSAKQRGSPAPPPPPKGGTIPPPRVMSPLAGSQDRPPSNTSNPYAPSAPVAPSMAAPSIARTASPYNMPPSTAPPTNRYAPAPSQGMPGMAAPPQVPGFQGAPPPSGRPPIAPPPQASQFQGMPPPMAGPPPAQRPPSSQFQAGPPPMAAAPISQQLAATAETRAAAAPPPARKHPKGDRSHIDASAQPIFNILSTQMAQVKARAPASYKPQVDDTEKRLNILFDHLNNEDLLTPDTIGQLIELSQALEARDVVRAGEIQVDIHQNKVEECGQWMVGVKRLIMMCKAMAT